MRWNKSIAGMLALSLVFSLLLGMAAPAASMAEGAGAARYNFFDDEKQSGFDYFNHQSTQERITDPVYSGTHALRVAYPGNTPGAKMVFTGWGSPKHDVSSAADNAYLHLAVKVDAALIDHIGANPGRSLNVGIETSGRPITEVNLIQAAYVTAADAGKWKVVDIPLSDFPGGADWSKVSGLAFQLNADIPDASFILDDVAILTQTGGQSNNAYLSGLELGQYSLIPGFNKITYDYEVNVQQIPASVDVTATADNVRSSIRINGITASSGAVINVAPNEQNKITVVVTAEDASASKTYTVTFKQIGTEAATITLFMEEQQTIKGWGAFPAYHRRSWDNDPAAGGKVFTIFNNEAAQKALYEDLGLTMMRVDLPVEIYDPGEPDGIDKTGSMQDLIDHLNIAKEHGVSDYLISIWSPPAEMKNTKDKNGQSGTMVAQLLPEYEDAFVDYIVHAIKHIHANGPDLPYGISFQNEPDFAPDFYEGNVYSKEQYQRVMKKLRSSLDANGLQEVGVAAMDGANPSSGVTYFGENFQDLQSDQSLKDALQTFSYHSYDQHYRSAEDIKKLRKGILGIPEKDIMMSEWSPHFLNDYNGQTGAGLTDEFGTVAFVTQSMLRDLVAIPNEYWLYWVAWYHATENPASNYQNLVVDERKTKLYHVLSTIWNSAKPGAKVKIMQSDNALLKGLDPIEDHLIAFSDKEADKTYMVVVNRHNVNINADFRYIPGTKAVIKRTTATEDMVPAGDADIVNGAFGIHVPAKSILFIETDAAELAAGAMQPPPLSWASLEPQPSVSIPDNTKGYLVVDESADAPIVDGRLESGENWSIDANIPKLVSGTANDLSKFGLQTDQNNLYIGVKVMDEIKVANDQELHNGDAVEIFLNGDGKKDGGYKLHDRQIIVNRNGKIAASNFTGEINGKSQEELLAGISCGVAEIEGGYTLEMKVPLSLLGAAERAALGGAVIGLDIAVDDDDIAGDETKRQGQRVWAGTANNWQNTSFFGTADLVYQVGPPVIEDDNSPIVIDKVLFDEETGSLDLEGDGQLTVKTEGAKVGDTMISIKRTAGPGSAPWNRISWKNDRFAITGEIRTKGALSFWYKANRNPNSPFTSISLTTFQTVEGVEGPIAIESSVPLRNYVQGLPVNTWHFIQIPLTAFPEQGGYWNGSQTVSVDFDWANIAGVTISGWMGQENGDLELGFDRIGFTKLIKKNPLFQVQNIRKSAETPDSVVLTWDAYRYSEIRGIKVYQNNIEIATLAPNATSYTAGGLESGKSYSFRLRVIAAEGRGPLSGAITVEPDGTAPSAPGKLAAVNVRNKSLTLAWEPSTDNVGVAGYEVYQGAKLLAATTATRIDVTGLKPNATYVFTVKAVDAAGNEAEASVTVRANPGNPGGKH